MDNPHRTGFTIIVHARTEDSKVHPELFATLANPEAARLVERFVFIHVVSFDWNCQQHITPRYNLEEIEAWVAPLKKRIAELEGGLATAAQKAK